MAITRDDLEAKLREIESVVEETRSSVKNTGVLAAAGAVAAIGFSFLLGKRRGKKSGRTRVEVYKIK